MKNSKTTMQSKFETSMMTGKILTVPQLHQMGFANPADAAYKARQKGLNVQRDYKTVKNKQVSCYSLDFSV